MTESYRRPPTQKALPLTDWPQADREAWLRRPGKSRRVGRRWHGQPSERVHP